MDLDQKIRKMALDGSEFLFRKTLWDIKLARLEIRRCILVYFLRCKVMQMKIQFVPNALKGNLKNEVLMAAFAAGSAGYFFQRTMAG